VNLRRYELLVEIELLEQRREELRLVEFLLILPEELAPVDDLAVAQVKQVSAPPAAVPRSSRKCRHRRPWRPPSSAAVRSLHRGQQVAQRGRFLEPHLTRRRFHSPRSSRARSVCRPSRNCRTLRTAAS